ncbi:hypothetical protein AAG570_004930 [Ranatra chinensis]|uniref:Uncharacterized protein n=1 Tax=Ranatra chinensis TaxID=642074 RepID=A0ABD0XZV7_9HEMI
MRVRKIQIKPHASKLEAVSSTYRRVGVADPWHAYKWESRTVKPSAWPRRCMSLKGRNSPPAAAAAHSSGRSTPTPTCNRKTNWEVIEHFTGNPPRTLRSASLVAVSINKLFPYLELVSIPEQIDCDGA